MLRRLVERDSPEHGPLPERAPPGDAELNNVEVAGGIVHVIDGVNLGPTPDRVPIR